jgi:hypothetical protein
MRAIDAVKTQTLVLLVGWLVTTSMPGQQTNTFSFTNKYGEVTHAVVLRVEPDGIVYKYLSGGAGGGKVSFTNLPAELRERFGYDPDASASYGRLQIEKRQQEAERVRAAQVLAAERARAEATQKRVQAGSRTVSGKVLQKLSEGLLVDSGADFLAKVGDTSTTITRGAIFKRKTVAFTEVNEPRALCLGLCLLQDDPRYRSIVDGDYITVLAYPIGQYSYTAVSGGTKTVRKFTASLAKAIRHESGDD